MTTATDLRCASVAQLLNEYTPRDSREVAHLQAMRVLLRTTEPFSRAQFLPGHFTASVFIVSATDRKAFLIEHPTLGLLLQPGGHFEPSDDTALAAARRELLEETGFAEAEFEDGLFDVDVHEIPERGSSPRHLHFDLRLRAVVEGLPVGSSPEGVRGRWIALDALSLETTDESVRRMGRKCTSGVSRA